MSIGVEEEFLLADAVSGHPLPRAAAVLARAGTTTLPDGGRLQPELSATQLEAATGICHTLDELQHQLLRHRLLLAEHAAAEGAVLLSAGLPVICTGREPLSPEDRFQRIGRLYPGKFAGYLCCACQVHVGVSDRDTAVRVVNRLRPWLPTLLAVSVNSPWTADGRPSDFGSRRTVEQARFPGSGIPPLYPSYAAYAQVVAGRVSAGELVDKRMTFAAVRPSAYLPTVEIRVADAAASVSDAVLQAALVRALVRTALTSTSGAADADDGVIAAALRTAARHGLAGPAVDPFSGRPRPAVRLLEELLGHVRPALAETGDLAAVEELVQRLLRVGTGAQRQCRAATADGRTGALRALAAETVRVPEPLRGYSQSGGEP